MRYTKNGGMRFLRLGRLQMSWCVCRTSIIAPDRSAELIGGALALTMPVVAAEWLAIGLAMAGY